MQIVELFQFVENPKNRFLNIGGVMVNINQIATMKWVTQNPIKGDVQKEEQKGERKMQLATFILLIAHMIMNIIILIRLNKMD